MITKRIIPCLDVKDGRVVKGVNFAGLQDMADPVEMARYYNAAGADELVFYDITASVEGRTIFTDILRRVASEIFIPLTVGGGISDIDQIRALIPWPCAAASILGANTKIFHAVPLGETKDVPGTLCARKKGIEAACGDGKSILITELQPDGGKRMAANAFLNGKRIAAGTVLDA